MEYTIFLLIQCASIFVLAFESIYVFFKWKTRSQSFLFAFCFATLINNVAYYLTMTATTSGEAMFSAKFAYLGKVWIPLSFFAMVMDLCEVNISKKVYSVLVLIHLSIFFLVFTSDKHNLYYGQERKFVTTGLFPHNEFSHMPLYNLYSILLAIYIVIGLIVLCQHYSKEKEKNLRKLYRHIIYSIIAMAIGFATYMMKITNGYDSTSLGYAVASVIIFVAIFRLNLLDTLTIVRDYVVDTISEGIIATDHRGKVIYFNKPALELFDELNKDTKIVVDRLNEMIEKEEVIRKGDKIYEPVSAPLYHGDDYRGNIFSINDVTARYKHMEELKEQKEIAEAANESKSAFLSVVSHEIRTPMNAVVGMTELLLRDKESLTDKQEKYLNNIKNSGSSLVMIVNDILDQSKIEAGKMEIVEDAYELKPMVDDVKMIIENRVASKPVHIVVAIDENVPEYLIGDSLRIRQILINLMNNSIKFTEHGFVELRIKKIEDAKDKCKLRFSVRDSGQGIKPKDLFKLGQAYSQVDVRKNHSKEGTGLGLSISNDFIKLMGGVMEITSEYEKGSEFSFAIWQGVTTVNFVNKETVNKQAWQEEERFTMPNAKILIVDDMDLNLVIMSELLQPLGALIDTANSGEKAIELIKENKYDLVFMDYMMPYMDGVETTEKIRSIGLDDNSIDSEYYKTVPILALSGDDSTVTKDRFLRAGIDDFIIKPVNIKILKKMILKWLAKELIIPEK